MYIYIYIYTNSFFCENALPSFRLNCCFPSFNASVRDVRVNFRISQMCLESVSKATTLKILKRSIGSERTVKRSQLPSLFVGEGGGAVTPQGADCGARAQSPSTSGRGEFIGPADCDHSNCNHILLSESSKNQSILAQVLNLFKHWRGERLRPTSLLRFWMSEGFTQAES